MFDSQCNCLCSVFFLLSNEYAPTVNTDAKVSGETCLVGPLRQTEDLKNEIAHLRLEVQNAMKHQNPSQPAELSTRSEHESDESEEDDDDDEDEGEFEDRINKMNGFNKMRQSVCAEVYGQWNKKEKFTLTVIPKSDEEKEKLEVRAHCTMHLCI